MASIIRNLRQVRGMGILADRNGQSPSLEFRRFNLIYGFNGSGKTTLSRVFASLQDGVLHPRLPPSSSFEVSMNDGSSLGFPSRLTGLERRVLVFNGDFIDRNLQWTQGRANPVFFIGAEQADAATELATLEGQIGKLTSSKITADSREVTATRTLSTFKRERAKLVSPRLHLGNRKYEAPQLVADFSAWAKEELVMLSDEELSSAEDVRRQSEPQPAVDKITLDLESVGPSFKSSVELCGKTIGNLALAELERFPEMLVWMKQGYDFHEAHRLPDCLFCGSSLSSGRRTALANALDDRINRYMEDIGNAIAGMGTLTVELGGLDANIPSIDLLSTDLRPMYKQQRERIVSSSRQLKASLARLAENLALKKERPAEPVDLARLPSQAHVESQISDLQTCIANANTTIERHNQLVGDFATHKERAGEAIRRHFVAESRAEYDEHTKELADAQADAERIKSELGEAKQKADELRAKVRTHGPAATAINKLIASYLGHNELTVRPIDQGYELDRHGHVIEGLPSEGEKTAIAIAYFLSAIESEGRKLKDLIVVVDDPVSSLDTKALNFACGLVRNRLSGASQLFVLTHNQQCMNEFRKAWKNRAKPLKDDEEPTATFLFMDVALPAGQTKRVASFVEMPRLLREYDSEYHFLFHHVLKFAEGGDNHYDYGYMIPNILRRVLDIFLAFKCPGNSGLPGKLDQICKDYPDLDRDRLSALERLSQVESHSDNLDDIISFSSMTMEESKEATTALLAMMEKVDGLHVAGLRRLCR
jgi:wobble nucleotide-excising tRNase